MKRRSFLTTSVPLCTLAVNALAAVPATRRVAVIGHTGRGNYGHGLDTVWQRIPEAEIVAVADADQKGLSKELRKLQILRGYSDYRKLLEEVRPEFVSIAPRHVDQHFDMAMAAIRSGARGLYIEKPFCRTPEEADALIAASAETGAKIAVAHRNRYHPAMPRIKEMIDDGRLGRLLEIRGRGKCDHRGGGEDLWVLGCHVLNLVHYFAGEPTSCAAIMLQDGRRVTASDVAAGNEGLGPLAANEVHATYMTQSGVVARFDSIANDGTANSYCMQLVGTQGIVTIHIDQDPVAHFLPGGPYEIPRDAVQWIPITSAGVGLAEPTPDRIRDVQNHAFAVRGLIDAVDTNRKPLCDARDAATVVEMICAVFESHRLNGQAVEFPLIQRGNALAKL